MQRWLLAFRLSQRAAILDSVEQAMAVTLVNGYAVRHRPVQIYRGGMGSARLRGIKELVHAKLEDDLGSRRDGAFGRIEYGSFRANVSQVNGRDSHQFVLRQRLERAKTMLRAPSARVLDAAVACGFKTQQHFAEVFRYVWGISQKEYRQYLADSDWPCAAHSNSRRHLTQDSLRPPAD